ncbi:hypothetical protein TNCV_1392391 [Trichonephila clavipes]|nr:hypothetical protein TNCV_1392391 [Trichonephila clavipes]
MVSINDGWFNPVSFIFLLESPYHPFPSLLSVDFLLLSTIKAGLRSPSRLILLRDMEHELAFTLHLAMYRTRGRPWGLHHLYDELSGRFNSFKAFRGD